MKSLYTFIIAFILLTFNGEAQVTVTLPNLLISDPPGTTVEIPITVDDLSSLGVTAYQFVFHYESSVLIPKSPYFQAASTLTGETGMLVVANASNPNQVNIAAAGSVPLEGEGTLLMMIYETVATEGSSSLELSDFYFNAGTPTANLINGSFTISSCIPENHFLLLPPGWSGISSYLTPVNPDMVNMFSPIVDNLLMVSNYSFTNQYSPPNAILPTENWDASQGYFIKMDAETVFVLSGCETEEKTIILNAGWNLVPVVSNCIYFAEEILAGLDFEIVQQAAGLEMYWPEHNIQNLYFLEPGKAYLIKMNSPGNMTFQGCP